MAEKVSLKPIYLISLILGIGLILFSCVHPVDVDAFLDDKTVKDVIGNSQNPGLVIVDQPNSDVPNLIAGDRKISGLASGEYYRLEEYDGTTLKRNLFVKADGNGNYLGLGEIGRLTGTEIKNLKNDFTYRVKKAEKFDNGTGHKYFVWGDAASNNANISNGEVTIPGTGVFYFNLDPVINKNKDYEVRKIAISGTGNTSWIDSYTSARLKSTASANPIISPPDSTSALYEKPAKPEKELIGIFQHVGYTGSTDNINDTSLIKLEGIGTESEYVFAEYNGGNITKFIFLIIKRTNTVNVTINDVSHEWTGKVDPDLSTSSGSYSQSTDSLTINIIVSNASAYSTFEWYVDGKVVSGQTGSTLTITEAQADASSWYQKGVHEITLIATEVSSSRKYSGTWEIICN